MMKKFVAAVLAVAMMGFGLVALTSGPASAACPYSGCVRTSVVAKERPHRVKPGQRVRIKFTVAAGGNVAPKGSVRIVVKRKGGGFNFTRTVNYKGGSVKLRSNRVTRRGGYVVRVRFTPAANSIFLPSGGRNRFRVT